jgi:hypothetical protein
VDGRRRRLWAAGPEHYHYWRFPGRSTLQPPARARDAPWARADTTKSTRLSVMEDSLCLLHGVAKINLLVRFFVAQPVKLHSCLCEMFSSFGRTAVSVRRRAGVSFCAGSVHSRAVAGRKRSSSAGVQTAGCRAWSWLLARLPWQCSRVGAVLGFVAGRGGLRLRARAAMYSGLRRAPLRQDIQRLSHNQDDPSGFAGKNTCQWGIMRCNKLSNSVAA